MIRYTARVSKNGVVYYISVPKDVGVDIGETVLVRLTKEGVTLGIFMRKIAKLGNRKIITLPHSKIWNKIWRILHGHTVDVELEKIEVKDIDEIVKKIVFGLRST